MVFYETVFLIHNKFAAHDTQLLIREASRAVTEREGCIFRLLDLGWRYTAQPVRKKRVGTFHYGRFYSMTWGGPPLVVPELKHTFLHSTGVLRYITTKIRHPKDLYIPRSTFYPTMPPNGSPIAPPLMHHTAMPRYDAE
mmetsp:Transcript_28379/g.80184  ORF Transcript_28379/g.80184 Transcript_28379/m.80184 type:complete len:139 (-) Transcript_28379:69-485(-)